MSENDIPLWAKIASAIALVGTGLIASLRGIFVTQARFEVAQSKCQESIKGELTEIREEQKTHGQYLSAIAISLKIKDEDIPKL